MDREYPFPKRTDGHPKLVQLIKRLFEEHADAVSLAGGVPLTIFVWDTDHSSPLIKEALAADGVIKALEKQNALLVKEGPQSLNDVLTRFVSGEADERATREKNNPAYHAANPALHRRLSDSWHRFFVAAKEKKLDVFYPETDGLAAQQKGSGAALDRYVEDEKRTVSAQRFVNAVAETGGRACSGLLLRVVSEAMPNVYSRAVEAVDHFRSVRRGDELNHSSATAIAERRGKRPAVVHYGAAHGALHDAIAAIGPTAGITIITSRRTAFEVVPTQRLGQYVYFAAEDEIVRVPEGVKERAAFIERLADPENAHDPHPQSHEEDMQCFDRVLALQDPLWLIGREARRLNPHIASGNAEAGEKIMRALKQQLEKPGSGWPTLQSLSQPDEENTYRRYLPVLPDSKVRGRDG